MSVKLKQSDFAKIQNYIKAKRKEPCLACANKNNHCHFCGVYINQIYYEIDKYSHEKELYIELVFETNNGINIIKQTFDSIEELINFIRLYIESQVKKYGWLF